jgi:hypothetical protein
MNNKNEKNEKSQKGNYFSNLGSLIKKGSETFSNKLMDKISEVLDKGKITIDKGKEKEKNLNENIKEDDKESNNFLDQRKMILNKEENIHTQTQNFLTIQEDEDHKIFKYCLDYEDEEEYIDEDDSSEEEDKAKKKLASDGIYNSHKSPNITVTPQEKNQDIGENKKDKFFPEAINNQIKNSQFLNRPELSEGTPSQNIRYNFDKISENNKNQHKYNKHKIQGISLFI